MWKRKDERLKGKELFKNFPSKTKGVKKSMKKKNTKKKNALVVLNTSLPSPNFNIFPTNDIVETNGVEDKSMKKENKNIKKENAVIALNESLPSSSNLNIGLAPTVAVASTSLFVPPERKKEFNESEMKRREKDEDDRPGYIFMCNRDTKPECYRYRIFGLPRGKLYVVKNIHPGMKLFLYDFDQKLLYGVYEATSSGVLDLEPTAFNGLFPAQVQFHIFKDCLPVPEKIFRHAIKDNYDGGKKFKQELTPIQVNSLISLFRDIDVTPSASARFIPRRIPRPIMEEEARFHPSENPYYSRGNFIPRRRTLETDAFYHDRPYYLEEDYQPYLPENPHLLAHDPHLRNRGRRLMNPRDQRGGGYSANMAGERRPISQVHYYPDDFARERQPPRPVLDYPYPPADYYSQHQPPPRTSTVPVPAHVAQPEPDLGHPPPHQSYYPAQDPNWSYAGSIQQPVAVRPVDVEENLGHPPPHQSYYTAQDPNWSYAGSIQQPVAVRPADVEDNLGLPAPHQSYYPAQNPNLSFSGSIQQPVAVRSTNVEENSGQLVPHHSYYNDPNPTPHQSYYTDPNPAPHQSYYTEPNPAPHQSYYTELNPAPHQSYYTDQNPNWSSYAGSIQQPAAVRSGDVEDNLHVPDAPYSSAPYYG